MGLDFIGQKIISTSTAPIKAPIHLAVALDAEFIKTALATHIRSIAFVPFLILHHSYHNNSNHNDKKDTEVDKLLELCQSAPALQPKILAVPTSHVMDHADALPAGHIVSGLTFAKRFAEQHPWIDTLDPYMIPNPNRNGAVIDCALKALPSSHQSVEEDKRQYWSPKFPFPTETTTPSAAAASEKRKEEAAAGTEGSSSGLKGVEKMVIQEAIGILETSLKEQALGLPGTMPLSYFGRQSKKGRMSLTDFIRVHGRDEFKNPATIKALQQQRNFSRIGSGPHSPVTQRLTTAVIQTPRVGDVASAVPPPPPPPSPGAPSSSGGSTIGSAGGESQSQQPISFSAPQPSTSSSIGERQILRDFIYAAYEDTRQHLTELDERMKDEEHFIPRLVIDRPGEPIATSEAKKPETIFYESFPDFFRGVHQQIGEYVNFVEDFNNNNNAAGQKRSPVMDESDKLMSLGVYGYGGSDNLVIQNSLDYPHDRWAVVDGVRAPASPTPASPPKSGSRFEKASTKSFTGSSTNRMEGGNGSSNSSSSSTTVVHDWTSNRAFTDFCKNDLKARLQPSLVKSVSEAALRGEPCRGFMQRSGQDNHNPMWDAAALAMLIAQFGC